MFEFLECSTLKVQKNIFFFNRADGALYTNKQISPFDDSFLTMAYLLNKTGVPR